MRLVRKADNLTTNPVPLSRNLGNLNSWNPLGQSWPVMGLIYLYLRRKSCEGSREDYITRNFVICIHQLSLGWSNQEEWDWRCMWHAWENTTCTYSVCFGRSDWKIPPGRLRHIWEYNIKTICKNWSAETQTGLIWLRIGAGGRELVNEVINLRVPWNSGNFLTGWWTVSDELHYCHSTLLYSLAKTEALFKPSTSVRVLCYQPLCNNCFTLWDPL